MDVLVTGSSGLIGSECVLYFDRLGWDVHGIDNNARREFFGEDGDTSWNLHRLLKEAPKFHHVDADIRDRDGLFRMFQDISFDAVIHAAAQPSHDLAARRPLEDFDINAIGTLNLLEATRCYRPDATFVFLSTNKVYGTVPNELPLVELDTRYDYARPEDRKGIEETCRIDRTLHSIFGGSKVAADIMVQDYGLYYGIKTVAFRCGCLTGPRHSAAELHGFLAYLIKCAVIGRKYSIYGYKGKQVRDNLHAYDVCTAIHAVLENPRIGEVYNLGGGRDNSISILEAIQKAEMMTAQPLQWDYIPEPRIGDHICYITDLSKFRSHYPEWRITRDLDDIFQEIGAVR